MALLSARGELEEGQTYRCRSILGTEFRGRIVGRTEVGGRAAIIPEIEGSAYVTGVQRFVLDPDDPLVHGFAQM
jgi:proline racemase